ncbi:Transposase DDE domain-containing protein [Azospirillum oryzae]|uniref:Transposase DDE domain-containing protein n=1 Tax=Azospirillum oryzae TaxID=286727 RepID=A0A1X7HKG1_9PROT|nr:IS5 family transposase [Azospirillum oryzae]SMF88378.1 Transposase DDE domain-containing protein [Azospirillum oryzae]
MPYKANEPRRHKIPKTRYRVWNWAAYDAALRRLGDLTIWMTPEAIAAWTPPASGRRGRRARYSDVAIEAGLMLRLAFGRPWRQAESLLGSLMRLLGLDVPVPDHTTFSRRSANLRVASALSRTDGPVNVLIDSTGLKVFGRGEWHLEKHGGQARRSWRKLHLAVDPDTGEILASELTATQDGDASLVGPLLDQIKRPIGTVLADGAYDGEPVYRAVAAHTPDAEVIIPPRSTAVPSETATNAPSQRDRHIRRIAERGRQGWQRDVRYGRRSLGEVAMMRYKQLIGRTLRARTLPAQKVEAAVGCKIMNRMTSLGMPASRKVA